MAPSFESKSRTALSWRRTPCRCRSNFESTEAMFPMTRAYSPRPAATVMIENTCSMVVCGWKTNPLPTRVVTDHQKE